MSTDNNYQYGHGDRNDRVLDIAGLLIAYGSGMPAVEGVNIAVERGQIIALIGESGSGKSSIGLSALGLLPQTALVSARQYAIDGEDALAFSTRQWQERRGSVVSMIFQEPQSALNPTMRVYDHLALALRNHANGKLRDVYGDVVALLRDVSIPNPEVIAQRFPHQLSGGQQQRVVIAMALAAQPSLIIADEPTTALDVTVQREIMSQFVDVVRRKHIGMVLISHDLAVVSQVADFVHVLLRGAVVQSGTVDEILTGTQHPYTKALLAAVPSLAKPRSKLLSEEALAFVPGARPSGTTADRELA